MKTLLWDRHQALGAKLVDFAGWEMPIQYKGILQEHDAVRQKAGVFDVSHMARVTVKGKEAALFLDWISTNKLKGVGKATYTCLCDSTGGVVDDTILYQESEESFFLVLNASRRRADLAHLKRESAAFDVEIIENFQTEGILALQGPEASNFMPSVKPMTFIRENDVILAGTGYTGSGGIEIFAPHEKILEIWDKLIAAGVEPIGLGARDTLRLEKGYALYGHELSLEIAPLESVSAWTVDMKKEFLGKSGVKGLGRRPYGIKMLEGSIPREGYRVFLNEQEIGKVTSGGFSPSLKIPIALILSEQSLSLNEKVNVEIRGKMIPGQVTALPFV